jgi:hypothetical protein
MGSMWVVFGEKSITKAWQLQTSEVSGNIMQEPKPPLVRDVFRYHASISESQLPAARSRYDYLIARRDQINDRIRTGSLALNAASLVGVFTALSTSSIADGRFGISLVDLGYSAFCFMCGLIGSVLGIVFDSYRLDIEAAEQFDRLSRQERYRGALDAVLTKDAEDFLEESMNEVNQLPPQDFRQSLPSILAINFSGGAWIMGMLLPLWEVAKFLK